MVSSKPRPILKTEKIEYSAFMAKYQLYEAMPEVLGLGGGYVRLDPPWWKIKGLRNSGGLTELEAKAVEKLLSKLNDRGKQAIQARLLQQRNGDNCRGLGRIIWHIQKDDYLQISTGLIIKAPTDQLKLKVVGDEIIWEKSSILEELQLV